ncbi:MAG TPA: hypothetical protein VGR07_09030, partial [Thermoanaerobaculia bacterium]|nr:hypothetical protein [Thermoanaerobaculia bacterium]
MSDEPMQPDDLAILALLTALEREPGEGATALLERPASDSESEETLVRLYTEVFGLFPYGLTPATPPVALKQRLMAVVTGDETQDVEPLVAGIARPTGNVEAGSRPAPGRRAPAATPATGTRAPLAPLASTTPPTPTVPLIPTP